jgi:hypothetical protein
MLLSGPAVAWLHHHFTHFNSSCSLLESALQLGHLELALQQPLACLLSAVAHGSHAGLVKVVKRLPKDQLTACFDQLGARGLGAGSVQGARGHVRAAGITSSSSGGAREAVVEGVWDAMQSAAQWRLGLLLLEAVAARTGGCWAHGQVVCPVVQC